jgi:hypothetical protein
MLPGDAKIPGRAQEKKTSASRHVGGPLVPGPRAAMVVSWWPGICGCSLCPCTFQGAGKRWLAIANRERDSQTRVRKRINRTVCSSVFASSHHQQNIIRTFTSVQSINQPTNQSIFKITFKITSTTNNLLTPQSTQNIKMVSAGFITSERPRTVVAATPTSSPRDSRRSSAESTKDAGTMKLIAQRTIAAIKKHHHEVNKAFDAVYGTKYYRS